MSVNREAITAIIPVAQLVATDLPDRRIVIKVNVINIGRAVPGDNDIVLDPEDELASRNHANLRREANKWYLEDTSRNGTLVDDTQVNKKRVELHEGARIRIGRSFDFTFHEVGVTRDQQGYEYVEPLVPISRQRAHETPPDNRGIWISPSAAIWRDGIELPASLSRTEYRLVKFLAKQPGDVADYEKTIMAVWGMHREKDSLHELIYRIRRKIEPDPAAPRYLIIRPGIGVVFFPQGSEASS